MIAHSQIIPALLIAALLKLGSASAAAAEPGIVAHRGASKDAPENTLPAFALAWERGADAIEGDFRLTRDGEIVCVHDADTKRVSGVKLAVRDAAFDDLRKLDVGLWKGEAFRGTKIPTLEEVLATVPAGKKIYIEIKCGPEIVPTLMETIEKSKLERDQIVVISFNADVIAAVEGRATELVSFWLTSFKKEKSGAISPTTETVFETLRRIKTDGVSTGKDLVAESFVSEILENDYQYHVWTVDDLPTAKRFETWGAMSITTNVPGVIRRGLQD